MSCGVPWRFMAIRSTSALCSSSPYPAHCFSDAALERTKPGATLLTVIPNGPSSCASCRVKPTTACFAEQFEAAAVAGSGLVVRQQVLALHPLEVAAQHPRPAAERRALLLAAPRAMAIERAQQRPGDLEFDAVAQASFRAAPACCPRYRPSSSRSSLCLRPSRINRPHPAQTRRSSSSNQERLLRGMTARLLSKCPTYAGRCVVFR